MEVPSLKKPLSLSLVAFITTYLVLLRTVSSFEVVSFLYNNFDHNSRNLILQGDVSFSSTKVLQLTRVDDNGNPQGGSIGRVLHSTLIPLWNSSGALGDIDCIFVFNITSPPRDTKINSSSTSNSNTPVGDGLTFFIASPDSTIPPASNGAFLGLFSNATALNNSRNNNVDRVVAIEFDTYPNINIGDPNYRHIGVDVNSVRSWVNVEWGWRNGDETVATIRYSPYSKRLTVSTSSYYGGSARFTYDIDLAAVLPEWVRVGFSASTGQYVQLNNVISWSFLSMFQNMNVAEEGGGITCVV